MSIPSTSKQELIEQPDDLCLVCNDYASGYHYGIPSCNGCKTFFRRAIVQNLRFDCQFDGQCSVDKSVRCACRHCRLKKCLEMGMDRNAIQNNREPIGYTKRSRKKKLSFVHDDHQPRTSKETPSPSGSIENWPELDRLLIIERRLQRIRVGLLDTPIELRIGLLSERILDDEAFIDTNGRQSYPPDSSRYCTEEDASFWIDRDATLMMEWAKCLPGSSELHLEDQVHLAQSFSVNFFVLLWTYYSRNDRGQNRIVFPNGCFFDNGKNQEDGIFVSERSQLIDGILEFIRQLDLDEIEAVALRALLAMNSNIEELSVKGREILEKNRANLASSFHQYLENKLGGYLEAAERMGALLLLGSRLAVVESEFRDACFAVDFFGQVSLSSFTRQLLFRSPAGDPRPKIYVGNDPETYFLHNSIKKDS